MRLLRDRWIAIWASLCAVLIITCVTLVIALVANSSASGVANCVNNVLGTRARPTALDQLAHITFAESLNRLFLGPKRPTPAQQRAALAHFRKTVQDYVDTLVADQKARDAHPLGRC